MTATYVPYAVATLLIVASLFDLKTGKIPNWLSYGFIALSGILMALSPDWTPYLWQLAFAFAAFAVGLLLYALVGFGAGAVKLLFGAALFMPMDRTMAMIGILLASIFLMGLLVTLVRGRFGSEESRWKVLRERIMPLSLPLTTTSLLALFWLQA